MSDSQSPEDLLQSALSSAFTPVSIAPAPPTSGSAPTPAEAAVAAAQPNAAEAPAPLVSQEERDKYEEERAATEHSWREQSAVERREAEERRARIAAERAASGETWESLEAGKSFAGPPNYGPGYPGSPSPADMRDSVSGEPSGSRHVGASGHASLEHSQRWEEIEDVPSMESSFPSLSFPSHSATSSEHAPHTSKKDKSKGPGMSSSEKAAAAAAVVNPPPSTTLSVFDSRLSTRARIIALVSSLSINLLLPFINGVMLGFGEIFARNMSSRFFGWKVPGGAATAVGVGAVNSKKRR